MSGARLLWIRITALRWGLASGVSWSVCFRSRNGATFALFWGHTVKGLAAQPTHTHIVVWQTHLLSCIRIWNNIFRLEPLPPLVDFRRYLFCVKGFGEFSWACFEVSTLLCCVVCLLLCLGAPPPPTSCFILCHPCPSALDVKARTHETERNTTKRKEIVNRSLTVRYRLRVMFWLSKECGFN